MNDKDIIQLALEHFGAVLKPSDLEVQLAVLAVAAEREACAKVCDAEAKRALWNWENDISGNKPFWNGAEQLTSGCADAILARSNT